MVQFNQKALIAFLSLSIAGVSAQGPTSRSLESEPIFCHESLDCGECILNGCSWAAGQCFDDCMQIADTSCYSWTEELWIEGAEEMVCEKVREEENNQALCSAQTDCGGCTSTSLSGGEGNCFWHPEWDACKPLVNDAWTMGTDVCLSPAEEKCFIAGGNCHSCLEAGCEWDGSAGCLPSCDVIADSSCYSPQYFENQSTDEICEVANTDYLDNYLCSEPAASDSCASCTATKKSDGKTSCQWYSDETSGESWCGTGDCDMFGNCGSATCNASEVPVKVQGSCISRTSCSTCLSEDSTCAWVQGACEESCDVIADAACYTVDTAPGQDICSIVEEKEANEALCSAENCQDCTAAVMLGTEFKSTCSWYTDGTGSGNGWCGIGECDMNGNCGSSDASKCAASGEHGNVRGGAKKRSSFLNAFLP